MKNFILAVASTLLVAGCESQLANAYTVYVDPALGDKTDIILMDLDEWEEMANVHFYVVIEDHMCDDSCHHAFTIHPATTYGDDGTVGYTSQHDTITLSSPGDWANVWVYPNMNSKEVKVVALHEIGHALGLHHTGAGTVMFWQYTKDQAKHVTCADVAQFNKLRHQTSFCKEVVE